MCAAAVVALLAIIAAAAYAPLADARAVLSTPKYQVFDEWWGPLAHKDNFAAVLGRWFPLSSRTTRLAPCAVGLWCLALISHL